MEGNDHGRGTLYHPRGNAQTQESRNVHGACGAQTSGLPNYQAAAVCVEYEIDINLEKDILHSITCFVNEVAISPGKFDKHIGTLLRDFNKWAQSKKVTTEVSKMVIEKSVSCQNFRYSGARFCTMLLNKSKGMGLRTFWDSLQFGLDNQKTLAIGTPNRDHARIRGLLMFLAELYVQLHEERAILGSDICFIIGMIVQEAPENIENIRSVCQALKLSGRYLDSTHNDSVEQIFSNLVMLTERENCFKSVFNQITSLDAFRRSNWGECPPVPLPAQPEPPRATPAGSETVYCDPDGTDLSAEESRFLEQNLSEPGTDDFKYFQEIWEAQDPMNELDEAFEEFLRFSKQE